MNYNDRKKKKLQLKFVDRDSTISNLKFIDYHFELIHMLKFVIIIKMVILKFYMENISSEKMINLRYYYILFMTKINRLMI